MIDITQWRAVIGSFHSKEVRCDCLRKEIPCTPVIECTYELSSCYPISWLVSICVVFNLLSVIFQLFLILCGDIETNPGPVTSKSCPICNAQIHIRKQVCTCGYVFNQRHRKPRLHVVDYTKGVDVVVTGSVGEGIVLRESAETTKTIEKRATKPCEESTEAKERSEDSTNVKQASEEGSKAYKTSEESTEAIQSIEDSTEVKRAGEEGSTASQNSEEGTEATNTGGESAEPIKIGEERNVAKDKSEEQGQMNSYSLFLFLCTQLLLQCPRYSV